MRGAFVASVTTGVLVYATAAVAAPPKLKGDYAFTGSAVCLNSPFGWAPQVFTPLPGDMVTSKSFAVEGIRTFNGDGTGSVRATEVGTIPPQGPPGTGPTPSADSAKFSFSFTYTVNDDGTFDTKLVPGTFQGTFLQGPRTGETFTVDKLSLSGLLTNTDKVLTLASVAVEEETVTFSGPNPPLVIKRVCHRSRILSWIGE